jgi:glycosyltransferase involved in cell wall biosynthesis
MSRPRILRIITRLAGGGPPVHVTLLNRCLPQHGMDSLLVYGDCGRDERNMEYLLDDSDRTLHLPELSARVHPLQDLRAFWRLWRLMRRYRPDIVHTHTAKAGMLGRLAAILAGVPCVVHTFHGHVLEGYFSALVSRVIRLVEKALAWGSSRICTVSRQQADELSGRFAVAPADKMEVIPLGLDLTNLLSLPSPDFQAPRWTIGWLGRFVPIKNLQLLLDVATAAAEAHLPIDFVIAGDGAERPWFESEIRRRRLLNTEVLGWQDQVEAVISRCHLLVLTSHREGTPLALIQGMAAGRPFISTAAGGTVDLAMGPARLDKGCRWHENAVLVTAEANQFLEVLRCLLLQPREAALMSVAAREFARRSFTGERLVSDIAHLYGVLLREAGRFPATEAALR